MIICGYSLGWSLKILLPFIMAEYAFNHGFVVFSEEKTQGFRETTISPLSSHRIICQHTVTVLSEQL